VTVVFISMAFSVDCTKAFKNIPADCEPSWQHTASAFTTTMIAASAVTIEVAVPIHVLEASVSNHFQDGVTHDTGEELKPVDSGSNCRVRINGDTAARNSEFVSKETIITIPVVAVTISVVTSIN
jgi:hypothetical protein